jgi:VanZ family protein
MNLHRVWWSLGALIVAAAMLVSLVPISEVPPGLEWNDKVSHLAGHGLMAIYFAGLVPRRSWWKVFLFLLLFGITVEFAQFYMQVGRQGDARDVVANSVGAALGLLLGRLGLSRWPEFAAWLLGRRATR